MGTRPKRSPSKPHRSGEWPKNITIRILLSVKILIEFMPQCPGPIHYSVYGEKSDLSDWAAGMRGGLYVELGRRDVHHDGRVCCVCRFLHRGLAVVGVTLLEGGNNVAS